MDIAVIGSNNVDLITYVTRMPIVGETIEAPDFRMGCGGKGSNQAVAASRLGSSVLMVTRVGNDAFARTTVENYRANGIATGHVLETETSSGVAPIFVDVHSRNSILIVKGANALLSPADVDAAADAIRGCKLIILQLEIALETVYHAIKFGRDNGIPVLLNPAPVDPRLDLEEITSVDWFMPNESELALLTGGSVETLEDIEARAKELLGRGIRNVVVTLGERGVMWVRGDEVTFLEGLAVDAVDTTGAGDAFIGAFAHGLTHQMDVVDALGMANRYAADSVTRRGTQTSYAWAADFEG